MSLYVNSKEIKGKVRFRDVEFKYPSQPNVCVLRDLNFVIEPGKTLAIVGESGCGKSTILSLVERFYDPSRGVIVCFIYFLSLYFFLLFSLLKY